MEVVTPQLPVVASAKACYQVLNNKVESLLHGVADQLDLDDVSLGLGQTSM